MDTSSSAPNFLIEKLPQVRRLAVFAWHSEAAQRGPVEVECGLNDLIFQGVDDERHRVLLDCHIDASRCRKTQHLGETTLSLPVTLDIKRTADLDLPSANELKLNRHLLCRQCRCALADLNEAKRVLPMPSEHWMELSELWVCDPHSLKKVDNPYGIPSQPLHQVALDGRVLVGGSYLILPSSVTKGTVRQVVTDSSSIQCSSCSFLLGTMVDGGYRLWKRCILASDEVSATTEIDFVFKFYSPLTSATKKLLDTSQARSSFRFHIFSKVTDQVISLHIHNWESFVKTSTFPLNAKRKPS